MAIPMATAPVSERRTIRAGELAATYYTCEPGPSQWIAVATIAPGRVTAQRSTLRLLVGAGDSEAAAIEHLRLRVAELTV